MNDGTRRSPEPYWVPTGEGWEEYNPRYRVQLWTRNGPPQAAGIAESLFLEEFEFDTATLEEVLAWASSQEGPRVEVTVYAFIPEASPGPGMVRLKGKNPTVA
jgi:hypothetical protein